jgi:hypothetical protein
MKGAQYLRYRLFPSIIVPAAARLLAFDRETAAVEPAGDDSIR